MKLYTKRGDDGLTDLFGGHRVPKDHLRIEAGGVIDELNSFVGLAAAACRFDELSPILREIQERLFEAGADLAMPRMEGEEQLGRLPRIRPEHIGDMERAIDGVCAKLPAMRHFVLPGGTELAARLHAARTICRRAERVCVALGRVEPVGNDLPIFLNRLSDLLFALARRANQLEGVEDVPWMSG